MKWCLVACINILYSRNWLVAESAVAAKFSVNFFCISTPNGLKRKTTTPPKPISQVEYVNTSYHTTFHQNISINVACVHKRALVPWKCQNGLPPLIDRTLSWRYYWLRNYKIVVFLASITNRGSNNFLYDSHYHILTTTLRMCYILRRRKIRYEKN